MIVTRSARPVRPAQKPALIQVYSKGEGLLWYGYAPTIVPSAGRCEKYGVDQMDVVKKVHAQIVAAGFNLR
jgi:hypothetical protein